MSWYVIIQRQITSFEDPYHKKCIGDDTKAPLAEAQTTCQKTKHRYILQYARIRPVTEILWKTDFPRKISLKSGWWVMVKNDF